MMQPQMVIIMENTLSAMALRTLLMDIANGMEVVVCDSLDSYTSAEGSVPHFFVSSMTIFRNPDYFRQMMRRTIVVTEGNSSTFAQMGFRTLDATSSEQDIVRAMLQMHHMGHPHGHPHPTATSADDSSELSQREREVLKLMIKGHINKEIADELHISLSTVIFHRNNICEKLNTRSIGRLTIYAVLNNIVSIAEI